MAEEERSGLFEDGEQKGPGLFEDRRQKDPGLFREENRNGQEIRPQFFREIPLFKEDGVRRLNRASAAVFGIGGVGSFAAEALVRSGIGTLYVCDSDEVDITNLNRQLVACHSTVGLLKTEVFRLRAADIDPECRVETFPIRFSEETLDRFPFEKFDMVLDCIDDVPAKLLLAETCQRYNVPLIMAMGAGNKLDPTKLETGTVYKTSVCPLARRIRREFKARGLKDVKCVFSREEVGESVDPRTPSSVAFVPSVMGLIMAGEAIKTLAGL